MIQAEMQKRYNAKILVIVPEENPKAGTKDAPDLILKLQLVEIQDCEPPGANNIGFMIFKTRNGMKQWHVNDIKHIELEELQVQGVQGVFIT